MADRRMMSKQIVESDSFLLLPAKTQVLYIHLLANTDDYGFTDKPKSIARSVRCTAKDLKMLEDAGFITIFESGVVHITNFDDFNKFRTTRKPTRFQREFDIITMSTSRQCCAKATPQPNPTQPNQTQPNHPTLEEVDAFVRENDLALNAKSFFLHCEKDEWKTDGKPIRDWRALAKAWAKMAS